MSRAQPRGLEQDLSSGSHLVSRSEDASQGEVDKSRSYLMNFSAIYLLYPCMTAHRSALLQLSSEASYSP